jgi:hypothetical protein
LFLDETTIFVMPRESGASSNLRRDLGFTESSVITGLPAFAGNDEAQNV